MIVALTASIAQLKAKQAAALSEDIAKATRLPGRPTRRKLTEAQRAKVKSLIEDEGEARAAATAWVLAMEAK